MMEFEDSTLTKPIKNLGSCDMQLPTVILFSQRLLCIKENMTPICFTAPEEYGRFPFINTFMHCFTKWVESIVYF